MTQVLSAARAAGSFAMAVFAVAGVAIALTLSTQRVEAQGAGTTFAGCVDRAWTDLNDCYMSGSGYWHDVGCEAAYWGDYAGCAADMRRALKF